MIWRGMAWLGAAVLALFHAWMLFRLAVNFPFQDDFSQFLTVPGDIADTPTLSGKIAYLVSSSGDHRILTLRLAALFQAGVLGGINFRGLIFWGNLLCAATGLLALYFAKASFRPWLAVLLAALLFSPSNWLPQYWASASLQHYSMLAYAFGAIFCLNRPQIAWQAGGLFLGLCAAMTGANGLMVLPVGAGLLYSLGRRRTSALWIVATIAIFALYFIDYRPPPGRPPPLDSLHHPLWLPVLALGTLGSIGERFSYAVAIGAMLVMVWIWLIARFRTRPLPSTLLAWMGFLLLSAGTVAFGRAPFGNDAMLNSRYHVYSELAVFLTIVALLWHIRYRRGGYQLLLVLSPVTAIWFWQSWESNLPPLADLLTQQQTSLSHYLRTGHGIYRGFPPQVATDNLLKRANEDGYFIAGSPSDAAPTFIESDAVPVHVGTLSLWSEPPIVDASTITVRGFMRITDPDLALWVEGNNHLFKGILQTQRLLNPVGADWVIFWNTWFLRDLTPGRYRTGYSSGDIDPPAIAWTDSWLEVK